MTDIAAPETLPVPGSTGSRQIRGSSLLLTGRVFAVVVNLGVQVLTIRYLSKSAYGAFAYALSVVSLVQAFLGLGLERGVARFIPIFDEQRDYPRMLGVLVGAVGCVLSLGIATVLVVVGARRLLADTLVSDELALAVLLVLIALAPIQALDTLLLHVFAVFGSARSIFFRRHILGPLLKLAVVVLLVLSGSSVFFLAGGYVVAGLIGVGVYGFLLVRLLRAHPLLAQGGLRTMRMPVREVLAFSLPLLTTDLVFVAMTSLDAMLLGYYGSATDVAALRAVQPTASLNHLVLSTFGILFTPMASRLFARGEHRALNSAYWQMAAWMTVLSFPVFAVTFAFARPVTVALFGGRYEGSAVLLAILAVGYYCNASFGPNGVILSTYDRVRSLVVVNLAALALNVGVNLLLIPRFGPLGAAVGTASTLVAFNVFKQVAMAWQTPVAALDRRVTRIYPFVAGGAVLLLLIEVLADLGLVASLALAALASAVVLLVSRGTLDIGEVFPELRRLPILRMLIRDAPPDP